MWYVYILKSDVKKWYYVGSTNRLDTRIREHNHGLTKSTKPYIPLKLVWSKEFDLEKDARNFERKLKDQRMAKEEIIREIEGR